MKVIRIEKKKDYTIIHNGFLRQNKMSLKTKGLMAYLLSLPDDWKIWVTELANNHSDGITSIKNALKELERFGYLKRDRIRDLKGRMIGMEYILREIPNDCPSVDNPSVDNPLVEKSTLINNNKTNDVIIPNNNEKAVYPLTLNLEAWNEWVEFRKKEYRLSYKTLGEKKAFNNLIFISDGDKEKQRLIIEQSMANGWKGLFKLKENKKSSSDVLMDAWQQARENING